MSDRSITSGVTRLANMLIAAEKQIAQMDSAHKRFMAVQEDTLAQMRVTVDDLAVMVGIIPQVGSPEEMEGRRELPAGPPKSVGSGPQPTFTAGSGNGSGHPNNFQGMDT